MYVSPGYCDECEKNVRNEKLVSTPFLVEQLAEHVHVQRETGSTQWAVACEALGY